MRVFILTLLVGMMVVSAAAEQNHRLWIFVANFEDQSEPPSLPAESKLTTFLFLNYWTKLQKPLHLNPGDVDFGGGVTWDVDAVSPHSFEQAEALARQQKEDPILVIWGSMHRGTTAIFLQPNLSIRTDSSVMQLVEKVWSVHVSSEKPTTTVSVPLPNVRYEFSPSVIRGDLVDTLRTPWELPLLSSPSKDSESLGSVGSYFTRISSQGDYAEVKVPSRPGNGWIYVPRLSDGPTEFVEFPAGILAVLRHDWPLAMTHFAKIADDPSASANVKTDTVLLQALCLSQLGKTDEAVRVLSEAETHKVRSLRTDQYLAMAYVAGIADNSPLKDQYKLRLGALIRRSVDSHDPFSSWWKTLPSSITVDTRSVASPEVTKPDRPESESTNDTLALIPGEEISALPADVSRHGFSTRGGWLLLSVDPLLDGDDSSYSFANDKVGRWDSDKADLYASNYSSPRKPRAALFVPYSGSAQSPDGPHSGLLKISANDLDNIQQCPTNGYQVGEVPVAAGEFYCLRTRDGKHYAKIHIRAVSSGQVQISYEYQPDATKNFWSPR
jgi:hypothetical protein